MEGCGKTENKSVSLKCLNCLFFVDVFFVGVYTCAVMCHMCVFAAIWEAVKTHRDALEVFYHAAVIVGCLLAVAECCFPSGNFCVWAHSASISVFLHTAIYFIFHKKIHSLSFSTLHCRLIVSLNHFLPFSFLAFLRTFSLINYKVCKCMCKALQWYKFLIDV